jgi:hypothetical protein
MNTAAVAGTPFFAGNLPGIPFLNPATGSINLINESVIISECFRWPVFVRQTKFDIT